MTPLVLGSLAAAASAGFLMSSHPRPRLATTAASPVRGVCDLPWLVLVAAVAGLLLWTDGTGLVVGAVAAGSVADALRRARRRSRLRRRSELRDRVLEACEAIAAEVRAGATSMAALRGGSAALPELAPVARAAELGADVPAALRRLAATPGAESAAVIAAAWVAAHRSGTGLAGSLDLAALTIRDERAVAAVVATEVASARATATMLALLPLAVLALGHGVGGDPWSFLLRSPGGVVCLAAGVGLIHLGLFWLDRVVAQVEP